jgi:hypothetical protein
MCNHIYICQDQLSGYDTPLTVKSFLIAMVDRCASKSTAAVTILKGSKRRPRRALRAFSDSRRVEAGRISVERYV